MWQSIGMMRTQILLSRLAKPVKGYQLQRHMLPVSHRINFIPDRAEASSAANKPPEGTEKLTLFQRFKRDFSRYWYVMLPVHITTSAGYFMCFYYLSKMGISPIPLMEFVGVPQEYLASLKDSDVVKVAVEMLDKATQLIDLDQTRPLKCIIQELCAIWCISDPVDNYALEFSDPTNPVYITEKNRCEIKNGLFLKLTASPARRTQKILDTLNATGNNCPVEVLKELHRLSLDPTFALEFINKQGHQYLLKSVQETVHTGERLAFVLLSFVELMDHGIVLWDIVEPKFIGKVANNVNQNSPTDLRILHASLCILESIVLNSSSRYHLVDQQVTLPNLIAHIQSGSSEIQQSAIALINALFIKAEHTKRRGLHATLSSKHIRKVILANILSKGQQMVGTEMAHQLYVLQTLLFSMQDERRKQELDSNDADAKLKLEELRRIAFGPTEGSSNKSSASKCYRKLGFQSASNPVEDLISPPGALALDNMLYFARHHNDQYIKFVIENSVRGDEHEVPFARASIRLIRLLTEDILHIGDPPRDQGRSFHFMFFTHVYPFEEFFCVCIQLLNKTWKEMRATAEDFTKVLQVVQDQIERAMEAPDGTTPADFEKLKSKLATLPYQEIMNIWNEERSNKEECETKAIPIVQLREMLTPDILSLIQQHRMQQLTEGTLFTKYSAKGHRIKDKFWYCRLSANQKIFHYGDWDEKAAPPSVDELPHKFAVSEIRALATARDCPHMKDARKTKTAASLAFSLLPEQSEQEALNFVAPSEKVFYFWTDGIRALLGERMTSKETQQDLEMLLHVEMKLRLLDTEGVQIPEKPPPVPIDPPNYDFITPVF
ncbi:engulfment and cell motility protein 1 [Galendromus occidentalis]|uniref:Engulfment and cell motility protein 1 n=1 Tax=Galendromus occidentalis TaxID=34638 RepID=A0AAJ6QT90_9ACAR|nr:engulfment and cell motility protein 1 [Galendromus occidentalis]